MNGQTIILASAIPLTAVISVSFHKALDWPYKKAIPVATLLTLASLVALSAAVMSEMVAELLKPPASVIPETPIPETPIEIKQ